MGGTDLWAHSDSEGGDEDEDWDCSQPDSPKDKGKGAKRKGDKLEKDDAKRGSGHPASQADDTISLLDDDDDDVPLVVPNMPAPRQANHPAAAPQAQLHQQAPAESQPGQHRGAAQSGEAHLCDRTRALLEKMKAQKNALADDEDEDEDAAHAQVDARRRAGAAHRAAAGPSGRGTATAYLRNLLPNVAPGHGNGGACDLTDDGPGAAGTSGAAEQRAGPSTSAAAAAGGAADAPPPGEPATADNKIVLVCKWGQDESHQKKIRIGRDEPLSKLMDAFRRLVQLPGAETAKFKFDGDTLDADATADGLGVDEGDVIDVIMGK